MGIALDRLFFDLSGGTTSSATAVANSIVADSNTIYVYQLNVYLEVSNDTSLTRH